MTGIKRFFTYGPSDAGTNAGYKNIHLLCVFLFISIASFSQELNKDRSFTDRLFFGGNVGAMFGTVTYIELSPVVGYNITKRWQAGVRGTYQYFSNRSSGLQASLYGGSIFTRYFVWEDLFAHGEIEGLNGPWEFNERYTIYNYYVGGGYALRIGSSAAILITGLYNLNPESPVNARNPTLNVGFIYGLPW